MQGNGGGVVFFIKGKVFGGDSGFIYTGTYQSDGKSITGRVKVRNFLPEVVSVMGMAGDYQLILTGSVAGNVIHGKAGIANQTAMGDRGEAHKGRRPTLVGMARTRRRSMSPRGGGCDDQREPRDVQGQIRSFRLPSRNERNWHKKDAGAPPPDWARDVLYIMTIAANWYGPEWCIPGTGGCRRFEHLLDAIRQHLYNGKCREKPPKGDSCRPEWESRRAKCRVEWTLAENGVEHSQIELQSWNATPAQDASL